MGKTPEKDFEKGRKYCLRLLAARPRSEYEIVSGLERMSLDDDATKRVLSGLKKMGLIDDTEFAVWWIDSRIRSGRPFGRKALSEELKAKGVSPGVIREALEMREEQTDDRNVLARFLEEGTAGKWRENGALKSRVFRKLVGSGFDPETVEEVMNRAAFL